MGKTGTYSKKKALTGTEQKTSKQAAREAKQAAPFRQQGSEILSKIGAGEKPDILQGGQIQKEFEPIRQESQRQFQQNVLPDIMNTFGRGSRSNSALYQALAAAGTNLQSQLNSQLAQYAMGERERQQNLQFGAGQALQQTGLPQAQLSLSREKNLYIPKGENIGTQLALGATEGAGKAAGQAAVTAAMASSREVKDNVREYTKGLETVREMNVKQYDYTVPVGGRQTDRVGLIAEDVPQEVQAMVGEIRGVDVYGLVAILINSIKQLDQKVKLLEESYGTSTSTTKN